ncbi:MAG: hypothetical protein LLG44_05480 [Chloroflexi bacterium]|nr:hypothetical protein [Chloroflexota bacterium]
MKALTQFFSKHPRLLTWLILALGMVLIILYSSRQVPLSWGQRAALAAITVLLAGGCAWIIHWE